MNRSTAIRVVAVLGFLFVALGAFGAHGLSKLLAAHGTQAIWEKAVLYHAIHVLVLLFLAGRDPVPRGPFLCFLVGILVFSGSLYVLAATNTRWLGAITPLGGIAFLIGWTWLLLQPGSTRSSG